MFNSPTWTTLIFLLNGSYLNIFNQLNRVFFIDFFYYYTYWERVFVIGELMNVDDPNSRYFVHPIVSRFNELRFCHSNVRASKREKRI